ncbi:MAG: biotin transporter BioY [Syntrophomonadaceae bacterium]|nr:biotin transporter BioY [Syntrophomonadaceae bacterium]
MTLSTQELVEAALFTAIMCILTVIVRMLQPVVVIPFSLQPLVMLLAAIMLSPRGVFLSMLAYLLLGLIGLPVFSLPPYGGPAYILVPSFGFLLAFPIAGWVQSRLIRRTSGLIYFAAGVVAIVIYYLIGLPYMYFILNFYLGRTIDVLQIIKIGFLPFITFDLLKAGAAAWLALETGRRLGISRENNRLRT